jgi:protein-tyrosine-phosphatase
MKALFLCRGNRYRSPIATALFNQMYRVHKAESAGTTLTRVGENLIEVRGRGKE